MTVLDPFVGVGSTLIACHKTNRKGIGVDLNKEYIKLAKKRFEKYGVNKQAKLEGGGIQKAPKQKLIHGDSLELKKLVDGPIHYCVTSPPYANILKHKGKRCKA